MENNQNNYSKGFSLKWVLIIIVIVSIISGITSGFIVYNNNKINNKLTYADLSKDKDLNQFLEVYANIVSEYYEDINKKELLEKAISGMMNYLGDDYSSYLNDSATDNLLDQLAGEYTGIGVSINNNDKSIKKVYDNTPASKVGIKPGDIIVGINETDVTNMGAQEIVDLIKKNNDYFTLKLKREEEIINVSLKNETIISPNVEYEMIENTNIGYIYMSTFSKTLDVQVKKALNELENSGMTSLILDLRNNTGGYLDKASNIASMFIEKNKVLYSLSYKGEVTNYKDETDEHRNYNIIVLLNGNSASASEILAAALQESYGAKIVGETSFGKGKVQQTMNLNGGSMVKYTSAYWLTPKGTCIDGLGIAPDYQISQEEIKNEEGVVTEIIDRQKEKAISLLKGE